MNAAVFVIMLSLTLGAYFFGDFSTLYGIVPDGGSVLNAWVKGLLLGGSAWILINKLRDYITINSSIKLIVVFVAATSGYLYEAGKEQRVGRKLLAKKLYS
ncbi:MAG: hypothetical protein R3A80_07465 [Bdellovibrionota bacterium]